MSYSSALNGLLAQCSHLIEQDRNRIAEAAEVAAQAHSGQKRADGTDVIVHPLEVAHILAEWHADKDTIIAGLLHDALEDTELTEREIEEMFGTAVAELVAGVTKFTQADFKDFESMDRKVETLRKLFQVMKKDVRVAVIKLADRLHNVRTMDALPEERRMRFALETLNVYQKLAYHLCMNDLRRELGNRCIPFAYPDQAQELLRLRESVVETAEGNLRRMQEDILANDNDKLLQSLELVPRSLSTMHDLHGKGRLTEEECYYIATIAQDKDGCYELLKIIHTLYRPVSGDFRDYIAAPLESGYQSLQTTVVGPGNHLVQLRIRTPAIHEHANKGILVVAFDPAARATGLPWLERFHSLSQSTSEDSDAFWAAVQSDIFPTKIQITVNGDVIGMPIGTSALDAAYARYGADANRLQSIHINGVDSPFATILTEEDVLQCTLNTVAHVHFDWLKAIHTTYARTIVVDALKEGGRSEKLQLGQRLLQQELDHLQYGLLSHIPKATCAAVATHFDRESFEDVVSLVGEGVLYPKDIVLQLFPEKRKGKLSGGTNKKYVFRLHVSGIQRRQHAILPPLVALADIHSLAITRTNLRYEPQTSTFDLTLSGTAPNRSHYADFLSMLEKQSGVTGVTTLITRLQKLMLAGSFLAAFSVLIVDILLLPHYDAWVSGASTLTASFLQALPLLPILAANSYMLELLRRYVVRMRRDRWFLGLGFILNVFGLLIVVGHTIYSGGLTHSLIPLVAIFVFSMLYVGYRYFQAELLFASVSSHAKKPMTPDQYKELKKQKLIGYGLRFLAVGIWGLFPVFVKYSVLQELSPLIRVNIWAISGAVCGYILITLINAIRPSEKTMSYTTPINIFFWIIVVSNISYNYFLHLSLRYTTATSMNLIMSYAPIFSLIAAFVLWRDRIPYLQSFKNAQKMILIFGMSALGGTFLIYNDFLQPNSSATGDLLALIIAFSDVAFIMANIYYIKYSNAFKNTLALTVQHLAWIAAITFVLIQCGNLIFGWSIYYTDLTSTQLIYNILVGVFAMIGFFLTFEAFKRIDGLLAFLMFNLTPIIAFIPETLFFGLTIKPMFIIGAILIITGSVLAETVNSRCEREGL